MEAIKKNSMRKTFASTCKLVANVAMVMLLAATIFSSCNFEEETLTPSGARGLLVSKADSTMSLGHTDVTWEGTATTAEKVVIDGVAAYDYDGIPVVYVEQLGLPVYLVGEPIFDGDKVTYSFSDDEVIVRDFSFTSTTGVKGTSTSSWSKTVILGQLNDSTELCEALFAEEWAIWTDLLPAAIESSKSGTYVPRVLYKRIVKQALPAPEPVVITWQLRAEMDEVVDGEAYYTIWAEKLVNGEVAKTWSTYVAGISFGTWKPNVAAQAVTSTEFVVKDSNEALATDEDRNNLGTENAFSVINHSKVQYHFDVRFEALPDAEGSTERIVAGHINVWSNTVIFHNPETGKDMSFVFDGKATTTVNKVTADNVYTRTVQITCNGDLVDTQVGNVQLSLQ